LDMYHDIKFSEKEQAKVNMKAEDFNENNQHEFKKL
jgi:hypothetical protein